MIGYSLVKEVGESAKNWILDPAREYPVSLDPSVIFTGTSTSITEAEAQFGGLQRKLVYASSNWYAFYNDGTDVFYKKSSDGVSWGSNVDVDTADADNYNPSVWLEGTTIYVAWIDDSGDAIEVNTINTASSDALGTKCTSADQGTVDTASFTVSISVADDGTVYLAYSDTSTDTEVAVFKLTFAGCTFTDITGQSITPVIDTSNTRETTTSTTLTATDISIAGSSLTNGTLYLVMYSASVGGSDTSAVAEAGFLVGSKVYGRVSGEGRGLSAAIDSGPLSGFFTVTGDGSCALAMQFRCITASDTCVIDGKSVIAVP